MVGWLGRGTGYVGSRGVRGGEGQKTKTPRAVPVQPAAQPSRPFLSFPPLLTIHSFIHSFLLFFFWLFFFEPRRAFIAFRHRIVYGLNASFTSHFLFYYIHSNSLQLRIQTPTNTHPLPTVKLLAILPWFTFASGVLTAIVLLHTSRLSSSAFTANTNSGARAAPLIAAENGGDGEKGEREVRDDDESKKRDVEEVESPVSPVGPSVEVKH